METKNNQQGNDTLACYKYSRIISELLLINIPDVMNEISFINELFL